MASSNAKTEAAINGLGRFKYKKNSLQNSEDGTSHEKVKTSNGFSNKDNSDDSNDDDNRTQSIDSDVTNVDSSHYNISESDDDIEVTSEIKCKNNDTSDEEITKNSNKIDVMSDDESDDAPIARKRLKKYALSESEDESPPWISAAKSDNNCSTTTKNPAKRRRRDSSESFVPSSNENSWSESDYSHDELTEDKDSFVKSKALRYVKAKFPNEDTVAVHSVLKENDYDINVSIKILTSRRDKKDRTKQRLVSDSEESENESSKNDKAKRRRRRRLNSSESDSSHGKVSRSNYDDDTFARQKTFRYVRSKFPNEDIVVVQDVLRENEYKIAESLKTLAEKRDRKSENSKRSKPGAKSNESDELSGSESDANDMVTGSTKVWDSEDEDAFTNNTLTPMREQVLNFAQNSTIEDLQQIPYCGLKRVNAIIDARPFTGWLEMIKKFQNTKFVDTDIIEGIVSVIEMKESLKKILEKCEKLAVNINNDAGDLLKDISGHSLFLKDKLMAQPKILNENCTLKPHQLLAIEWMHILHTNKVNCILADEMGLGKTIETIGFLASLAEKGFNGPHAIIVPSSTLDNWIREFQKWLPSYKVLAYAGNQNERLSLRHAIVKKKSIKFDILITTYNLVTRNSKDLLLFKKCNFNYAVFDEAHMMKNAATQCYRSLMLINTKRRLLLTGTPLQNSLTELLSILMFAMPRLFKGSRDQIERMFKIATKSSQEGKYFKNRIEQAKKIMKPFILRRLKDDVLLDLPQKECSVIKCKMIEKQKKLYDNLIAKFSEESNVMIKNGLAMMMQLRKISNHPLLLRSYYCDKSLETLSSILAQDEFYKETNQKYVYEDLGIMSDFEIHTLCKYYLTTRSKRIPESEIVQSGKLEILDKMLPDIKQQGNKVLIFSQFTMVLDILESYLNIRKHSFLRLDGSTPVMERQDLMDEYNGDPDLFIFLLSTKSGGLGINLTSANVVILHDIDFNPFNDRQAEDRCHRVGQTRDVKVYRLISENSIEENMMERAQAKILLEKQITDGLTEDISEQKSSDVSSILKTIFNTN